MKRGYQTYDSLRYFSGNGNKIRIVERREVRKAIETSLYFLDLAGLSQSIQIARVGP
jgi:hypothetical protein